MGRAHERVRTNAHTHSHTHAHARTATRKHMHTHALAHARTCARTHMHTCTRAHSHAHARTHMHKHARACTCTCTCTHRGPSLTCFLPSVSKALATLIHYLSLLSYKHTQFPLAFYLIPPPHAFSSYLIHSFLFNLSLTLFLSCISLSKRLNAVKGSNPIIFDCRKFMFCYLPCIKFHRNSC